MPCSLYSQNSMPAAAGAVAAAAVADQMLGPKEDRHLAIVLVCICISYWSELVIMFIILLLSLSSIVNPDQIWYQLLQII